jgi:hypothetical protein
MKKPKLNERTIAMLEIYGQVRCGKYYYELKDFIDTERNRSTMLERTNLKTGDTDGFDWEEYIKEA